MAARRTFFRSLRFFLLLRPTNGSVHQGMVFEKLERTRSFVRPRFFRNLCNTSVIKTDDTCTSQSKLPSARRGKFKENIYRIRKLCEDRKFPEAIALLDSLLEDYAGTTNNFTSIFNCILHHTLENNDITLAEQQLSKMTKYDIKRDATTYYNLAVYYSQLGLLHKGIEVLKDMKAEGLKRTPRNFYPLISLAASTGELETMFTLYNDLKAEHTLCHKFDSVVIEGVLNSSERKRWKSHVIEIIHNMRMDRIKLSQDTGKTVKDWFESEHEEKWVVNWSTVNSSGVCQSCKHALESGSLSKLEHETLKQKFVNSLWKSAKGKDMMSSTAIDQYYPEFAHQILKSLEVYINETGPYDVVLDAPNVGYVGSHGKLSPEQIVKTVKCLLDEGKRVLVVGRRGILRNMQSACEKDSTSSIFKNCGIFSAIPLRSYKRMHRIWIPDDIIILLAAIHCGPNTFIVSNDLFRDHMHKMPLNDQALLGRWLRSNQILLQNDPNGGRISYRKHPCYDPIVQTTGKTWHFPLDDDVNWLCVNKHNSEEINTQFVVQ